MDLDKDPKGVIRIQLNRRAFCSSNGDWWRQLEPEVKMKKGARKTHRFEPKSTSGCPEVTPICLCAAMISIKPIRGCRSGPFANDKWGRRKRWGGFTLKLSLSRAKKRKKNTRLLLNWKQRIRMRLIHPSLKRKAPGKNKPGLN